jgi:hypothetical protein
LTSSASCSQPGAQPGHLGRQRLNLLPQLRDLGVLGLDHLPQPGIGRAQRSGLIRGERDIGHEPYLIIIGAE